MKKTELELSELSKKILSCSYVKGLGFSMECSPDVVKMVEINIDASIPDNELSELLMLIKEFNSKKSGIKFEHWLY